MTADGCLARVVALALLQCLVACRAHTDAAVAPLAPSPALAKPAAIAAAGGQTTAAPANNAGGDVEPAPAPAADRAASASSQADGASMDDPPVPHPSAWHLPWTAGETWYLTSGPHSGRRAALDFAPPNFNPETGRPFDNACSRDRGKQYWVRAAASGRISGVLRDGCPIVEIEHGNGETTNYFHLERKSVKALHLKVGDYIEAGQMLGHPSCDIGPKSCGATHAATGVHVHFYRTITGTRKRLPANGVVLSGWKVRAVGEDREGVMVKGTDRRSTRGLAVGRACAPSVGLCSGQRNDLESDNGRAPEALSLADSPSASPW